jgi:hypothetical protein
MKHKSRTVQLITRPPYHIVGESLLLFIHNYQGETLAIRLIYEENERVLIPSRAVLHLVQFEGMAPSCSQNTNSGDRNDSRPYTSLISLNGMSSILFNRHRAC